MKRIPKDKWNDKEYLEKFNHFVVLYKEKEFIDSEIEFNHIFKYIKDVEIYYTEQNYTTYDVPYLFSEKDLTFLHRSCEDFDQKIYGFNNMDEVQKFIYKLLKNKYDKKS